MRQAFPLLIVVCVAQPLARSAQEPAMPDSQLSAFFKDFLDVEMKHRPLEATRLGDHRYDHLLDDVSPKARQARLARLKQALEQLPKAIPYQKLSRAGQIDFEILENYLQKELWLAENTRPFEEDPRVYNDYITESVYLLLTQSTLPTPTR